MKALNNKSGILAAKSFGLGLILLLVFAIELTTWTIENVIVPSSIAIAETIMFGIKELNNWCDAQIEPKSKQVLAIKAVAIAGLLMPATEGILVTNPVLPSSNEVIVISPRCTQTNVKVTTLASSKAIMEVSASEPKRGRGRPKKSIECPQTSVKPAIGMNTVPPGKVINQLMEISTIEPKRGRQKKST